MRLIRLLVTLTVFFGLVESLAAQQLVLETTSGKKVMGEVVSDDGSEVEFRTKTGATATLRYDLLTPISVYRLRKAKTADDGRSQLDLAEWCVSEALYEQARTHYRAAMSADAEMGPEITKRVAAARTTAGRDLLKRGKAALDAGKTAEGRELLSTLLKELPLEPAAEEAASLLAADTLARKESALSSRAKRAGGASSGRGEAERVTDEDWSEDIMKAFGPAVDEYRKALDSNHDGLTSKNQSDSIKKFEKALKSVAKAKADVEKVRRGAKAEAGSEMARALAVSDEKLEEVSVDTRIHIADAYILRSSYNQATEMVNEGLADYPKNPRLLKARDRVLSAASNNDRGWVFGGRVNGGSIGGGRR